MGCSGSHAAAVAECPRPAAGFTVLEKYKLGEKLGKGGFAQVRSARSKDGVELAVKIQDLRKGRELSQKENPKLRMEAEAEAEVWRLAGEHKNLVCLMDAYLEQGVSFFLMERCEQSFQRYLQQGAGSRKLTEAALAQAFGQLLEGVAHLHERSIVHRDIKFDNVMVSQGTVKLCDFGIAKVVPKAGLVGASGTPPFMAPEVLKLEAYGCNADVWSVGVMVYCMFFGGFPYTPPEGTARRELSGAMKRAIRDGVQEPSFDGKADGPQVSAEAKSFVWQLLCRDPQQRPSAQEAIQMSYLSEPEEAELPCLRANLIGASQEGAFENRRVDVKESVDNLLLGVEDADSCRSPTSSRSSAQWSQQRSCGTASTRFPTASSCHTPKSR